jgi:cell wall-associated NlpC family hydrolase
MRRFLKGTVAAMSGLALAITFTAGFALPADAAGPCNSTFTKYHTVKAGSSGRESKAAQCLLKSAGYRVRADGSFSSADAAQLKKFQSKHRLKRTGAVNSRSWTALLSRGSTPTLRYGARGSAVARLQRALTASRRYVPATGYFGPITKNAVKSIQRSEHWHVSGTAGHGVWHVLQYGSFKAPTAKPTAKKPVKPSSSSSNFRGLKALAFAKKHLGDSYRWGASGPHSWDCSGLAMGAWKAAGVTLPHNARQQFGKGKKVSKSNLRAGDLVFFYAGIKHVGIYAGGGQVIHASRPGKPVAYIKLRYMPYEGARRPG